MSGISGMQSLYHFHLQCRLMSSQQTPASASVWMGRGCGTNSLLQRETQHIILYKWKSSLFAAEADKLLHFFVYSGMNDTLCSSTQSLIASSTDLLASVRRQIPCKRQSRPERWPKPGWHPRWRWTWKAGRFQRGATRIPERPTIGCYSNYLSSTVKIVSIAATLEVFAHLSIRWSLALLYQSHEW